MKIRLKLQYFKYFIYHFNNMDIYFKGIVLWDGRVSVGQDAIVWYFHRNSWKIIRKRVWNLQSWNYGNIWMGCIFGPKASTQSILQKISQCGDWEEHLLTFEFLFQYYGSFLWTKLWSFLLWQQNNSDSLAEHKIYRWCENQLSRQFTPHWNQTREAFRRLFFPLPMSEMCSYQQWSQKK